jgi:hypothetical protein
VEAVAEKHGFQLLLLFPQPLSYWLLPAAAAEAEAIPIPVVAKRILGVMVVLVVA